MDKMAYHHLSVAICSITFPYTLKGFSFEAFIFS